VEERRLESKDGDVENNEMRTLPEVQLQVNNII
jgi:hypothetical protein